MNKEQNTVPVAVSYGPVYVNGRVKFWRVGVTYVGKLVMNIKQEPRYKYKKEPESFDIVPGLNIPNLNHAEIFDYDAKSDTTLICYVWKDGLFGRGAERAWNFRLKIFGEIINNRHKEKVK